jgi:hypothetical protein
LALSVVARALVTLAACLLGAAALAQTAPPRYPTTVFEEGASSAVVTVGDVTAQIRMVSRPKVDPDLDVPVLEVLVGDRKVLEAVGVASGFSFPATEASIADIDPDNAHPEVYFASYSGGAHCCMQVVVATEVGRRWQAVEVGAFDGDGNLLEDLDGDGLAEIATIDNRFLYQFDGYAGSVAPLRVLAVRKGAVLDVSSEPRFLPAHSDWLARLEEGWTGRERWQSPGFLAGWVAARQRLGQGLAAWTELDANWDHEADAGEEVCLIDKPVEDCPRRQKATLKFPDRLKLFLEQNGYPLT